MKAAIALLSIRSAPSSTSYPCLSSKGNLLRRNDATLIGGGAAYSEERYLTTKIQRMGHMLHLPSAVSVPTPSNTFASLSTSTSPWSRALSPIPSDDEEVGKYMGASFEPSRCCRAICSEPGEGWWIVGLASPTRPLSVLA